MCVISSGSFVGKAFGSDIGRIGLGTQAFLRPEVPELPKAPPPPPPAPTRTATRLRRPAAVRAGSDRARLGTSQLRVPLRSVNVNQ